MTEFVTYIEDTLHLKAETAEFTNTENLPLYLRKGYALHILKLSGCECLLAEPKEAQNLTAARKQCIQLKKLTGMDCVLCLRSAGAYTKEKMLDEGLPFIIAGRQIYMPFLGVALKAGDIREIPAVDKISYTAQKLLLLAMYRRWENMTLTGAAAELGVSKMTATRCFDELQALWPQLIAKPSKTRNFAWAGSPRGLWDLTYPLLRSPIGKQYRLKERIFVDGMKQGGLSAVSHYSMLADGACPVCAVTKEQAKTAALDQYGTVPKDETPAQVIQVMRYSLDFADAAAIDPLSAVLSVPVDELSDPRVGLAIEEILEGYLNG
ncbi:MAG: hypothetical protein LBK56_00820 [Gracilibacteraceae bacterium]|jgi:hypothetical protein|nr:hypothetical protein [Gracilibacteraceae bacterium]